MIKKKLPLTIKAAYITGIFSVLATVILIVVPAIHLQSKEESLLKKKAERILSKFYGFKKIKIDKVVWLDFLGGKDLKDFYCQYNAGEGEVVDVFTVRANTPENIFHKVALSQSLGAYHISFPGGKTFFIYTSTAGSGSYLDIYIFNYDGMGKLKFVTETGGLAEGEVWLINNRLFVSGSSQKYELKFDGNTFKLERYREKLGTMPAFVSNQHVLAYEVKDGKLTVKFDDQQIDFIKSKLDYFSKQPIEIFLKDHILIDDNMDSPRAIRILASINEFEFLPGFFHSLKPKKTGKTHINIDYDTWYHIDVVVRDSPW